MTICDDDDGTIYALNAKNFPLSGYCIANDMHGILKGISKEKYVTIYVHVPLDIVCYLAQFGFTIFFSFLAK